MVFANNQTTLGFFRAAVARRDTRAIARYYEMRPELADRFDAIYRQTFGELLEPNALVRAVVQGRVD
jgi:hypothetical protein